MQIVAKPQKYQTSACQLHRKQLSERTRYAHPVPDTQTRNLPPQVPL